VDQGIDGYLFVGDNQTKTTNEIGTVLEERNLSRY